MSLDDRSMLDRNQEESDLAYHKRLVYGKLVDKSLADYDYAEIGARLYDKEYSGDASRKMMYGSCKTLQLMDRSAYEVSPEAMRSELDIKMIEFQKERQRFFDQRREYSKLIASEARHDHIYEKLAAAADRLGETIGRMYQFPEEHFSFSENEAVLVLSDWHYGLKTKNIFNEYDIEICKSRVNKVVTDTANRLLLHSCRKLHIVVLGDLFHGAIHNSARVASEELVSDQIMQVSEILAQSIEYLSSFVECVDVHMTYGNHARTVQNKKDSIHRDNMERLIPWWLSYRLSRYDNIEVTPDNGTEFLLLDVCGHGICASHGDNDHVKSSIRLLPTLFHKKLGRDVEYILLGDKHHRESYDELDICAMLCGSLCGSDDHANNHRLYSTPSQMLLIVNEECGVDAEYRLKCS